MNIPLGASILAADWSKMGAELAALEHAGVDYIHWDVMDNRYVPNLTFGWDFIRDCRGATELPFEAHLMAHEPERDIRKYVDAGCELVTVQPEACIHVHKTLMEIRDAGAKAGLALNPGTPLVMIEDLLDDIDRLLVMTVNPGFGGQSFITTMLPKIVAARQLVNQRAPHIVIEVDGGIKSTNVDAPVSAGATSVVCGSGLFGPEGKERAVTALREGIARGAAPIAPR